MPRKKQRSRKRVSPWQGTLRLGLVFSVLISINVYFFFLRGGTSIRALIRKTELAKQTTSAAIAGSHLEEAADIEVEPVKSVKTSKVKKIVELEIEPSGDGLLIEGVRAEGETIEHALKREGLSSKQLADSLDSLSKVAHADELGEKYFVQLDGEHRVHWLEVRSGKRLAYRVERAGSTWRAFKEERPFDTRTVEVAGIVQSSLFEAFRRSGEPLLASRFADLLSSELSCFGDYQPGDRFKVIVDKKVVGGQLHSYGPILAAEFKGRAGSFRAFWFQPEGGHAGGYFNEYGESVSKRLTKSPLKCVRGPAATDRIHYAALNASATSADYPGPPLTPISAMANGRVSVIAPRGDAGYSVTLQHGGGLEAQYSRLGKIARGLAVGQSVQRRQVIGYLGATGPVGAPNTLASAPRVRLMILENGTALDPLRYKATREAPLSSADRISFADAVASRLSALSSMEPRASEVAVH